MKLTENTSSLDEPEVQEEEPLTFDELLDKRSFMKSFVLARAGAQTHSTFYAEQVVEQAEIAWKDIKKRTEYEH